MGQLSSGAFDGSGAGVFPGGGGVRQRLFSYDFAVHGGATGTISIGSIPSGSRIRGGFLDVVTALTSGGAASVGIDSQGTGDIVATALISGAPWSTAGAKAIIPKANTPEASILMTADRNVSINITVANLTAGKFNLYLDVQGAN